MGSALVLLSRGTDSVAVTSVMIIRATPSPLSIQRNGEDKERSRTSSLRLRDRPTCISILSAFLQFSAQFSVANIHISMVMNDQEMFFGEEVKANRDKNN